MLRLPVEAEERLGEGGRRGARRGGGVYDSQPVIQREGFYCGGVTGLLPNAAEPVNI